MNNKDLIGAVEALQDHMDLVCAILKDIVEKLPDDKEI